MRDRLHRRGFSATATETVIEKLKQQKYLDDHDFVRMWINERVASKKWGKIKIRSELVSKGVDREIINTELSRYSDQEEKELALNLARKKYLESRNLDPMTRRRRLCQFLNRHGFDSSTIREIAREVASDNNENYD